MAFVHIEFLVEEISMEAFLREWLPRALPPKKTFDVHPFQGKSDLLGKLAVRLRGYAKWIPDDWRIIVIADRDDQRCDELKVAMEGAAAEAGLVTRTSAAGRPWKVVNRVAIEELEAWYFGDWDAVCAAFPRAEPSIPRKQAFRDSDAIAGGTWEAFERVMRQRGYFSGGLTKLEAAREIGKQIEFGRSKSPSFRALASVVLED